MGRGPSVGTAATTEAANLPRLRKSGSFDFAGDVHVAVKLRLMRMGKTKQPTYRLVAADARAARDGRFIEILGTYEPRKDPSKVAFETDKIVGWLKNGAQPTERVAKLFDQSGVTEAFKASKAK